MLEMLKSLYLITYISQTFLKVLGTNVLELFDLQYLRISR